MHEYDISFVVPFRNEGNFLRETCTSLASQELGDIRAEILLVDGGSTDQSRAIADEYVRTPGTAIAFRILENPAKTTPYGFNIGIKVAQGHYIGFGGAHTVYPRHFLRTAVELLRTDVADVVGGGASRFQPSRKGALAAAMASLYQSPMGAGVAAYWRRTSPGYVDTVFGGFYRRAVFAAVGVFNTRLTRNQDNELNSRVTAAGFRIYFHPNLSSVYVLKTDPRVFFSRALRFGFYHPQTWMVNWRSFKIRHAIPAGFVLYLVVLLFESHIFAGWMFIPLLVYVFLLLVSGIRVGRLTSPLSGLLSVPLFFGFHVTYGLGTWFGAIALLRNNAGIHVREEL